MTYETKTQDAATEYVAPRQATPRGEGIEELKLGPTSCHYLTEADFISLCSNYLTDSTGHHVVTLTSEMVVEAAHNAPFAEAINAADLRVPDTAGLIWARWFIRSQFWSLWPSLLAFPFIRVERIAGVEMTVRLAELCSKNDHSLYLLGGSTDANTETARMLKQQFPTLTVYSGPAHTYQPDGPALILADIQKCQPAVVLVAYGAPKQALWIQQHLPSLPSVRIAMGVGGSFDMLSGRLRRAPAWMRRFNIEWLWRLILEPRRAARIWRATVSFPLLINQLKQHTN